MSLDVLLANLKWIVFIIFHELSHIFNIWYILFATNQRCMRAVVYHIQLYSVSTRFPSNTPCPGLKSLEWNLKVRSFDQKGWNAGLVTPTAFVSEIYWQNCDVTNRYHIRLIQCINGLRWWSKSHWKEYSSQGLWQLVRSEIDKGT